MTLPTTVLAGSSTTERNASSSALGEYFARRIHGLVMPSVKRNSSRPERACVFQSRRRTSADASGLLRGHQALRHRSRRSRYTGCARVAEGNQGCCRVKMPKNTVTNIPCRLSRHSSSLTFLMIQSVPAAPRRRARKRRNQPDHGLRPCMKSAAGPPCRNVRDDEVEPAVSPQKKS